MKNQNVTVTISMPESLKEQIEARIAEANFGNQSEYFRSLARADLAEQEKRWERLRALVQEGEAAFARGEARELTDDVITEIMHGRRAPQN